jgi:hypothetical protein
MTTFTQHAQEAQQELDRETNRLKEWETKLQERAAELAKALEWSDKKAGELNSREKDLDLRNEYVTSREITLRRDDELRADREEAAKERAEAEKAKKAAFDALAESKQAMDDLLRRELALSQREKDYKLKIEEEVMRRFTFGR